MLACLLACLFTAAPVTRQSITAIKLCESTLVLASGERQNFPLVPTLIPASTHCRRYLVTKDWSAVWTFDVVLFYLLPPTIYELSLHPERCRHHPPKLSNSLQLNERRSPGCSQGRGPILTDDRITCVLAGGHRPRRTRGFTDRPRRPRPVRAERTFEPYLSNMQLL
ncbi:Polyribonucleotide nucleotidyltransferase [Trichinella spiralis]|uniref:Polyribonucleotide nucleotidyltransferase n=1 Tax=Trichinella spiralis TaxID=6334 RepID=A0ABR3KGJ8_TRISP